MTNIKTLVSLIISFMAFGAQSQELKIYNGFEKTVELTNEQKVEGYQQFCPSDIFVVDSLLVIREIICSDYFFYVYSKKEFKYIGAFGKKGKGPGEFGLLNFNSQYEKDKNGRIKLWVYDSQRLKAYKIDLKKAINDNGSEDFIEKKIPLPAQGYPTNKLVVLEDNHMLIGNNDMSEFSRYYTYDYVNDIFKWSEQIPKVPKGTPYDNIGAVYFGRYQYSLKHNVIVSALGYFPRLDFINENGIIYYTVIMDYDNPAPTFRDINHPDTPDNYYYTDCLKITDNYIVINNYNVKYKFIKQHNVNSISFQFFDWNGTPKYNFILKKKNIDAGGFSFDEEDKILYFIDNNNEDYPIKYYDLKKFF
jgi:hypothetical protein